jgi:hypothetical protein
MQLRLLLAGTAVAALAARPAAADLFILDNDSQIRGTLVNADETPRKTYVIRTDQGEVTLERQQVVKVVRESPDRVEYESLAPTYPDTVAGQWALAEWCRERNLGDLRERHLRRIVELDPEHVESRRALGYMKHEGRWTTQEELMTSRGFVYFRGKWVYPQEVQLYEERQAVKLAELDWQQKLDQWRKWLDKADKAETARAAIVAIDDPYAVKTLRTFAEDEQNPSIRLLYVEALGRIGTPAACGLLIDISLLDAEEEVRLSALDELERHKHPDLTELYVKALKHKSNAIVNRAGIGLARLRDPSSVGPLIDALVTTHKETIQVRGGGTTTTFGDNGTGFQQGPQFQTIKQDLQNEAVRDALVLITGANFHFDEEAWHHWHVTQRKDDRVHGRRD